MIFTESHKYCKRKSSAIRRTQSLNLISSSEMELKPYLSLLFFCVIHEVGSFSKWTANIPSVIPALQGSCVVIPCSYFYPKPSTNLLINRRIGLWKTGTKLVSSNMKLMVNAEYKKRARFLGNLQERNCTMLLDRVRSTDTDPFYFSIRMPQYKSFSYTNNAVSINVTRVPQPPSMSVKVTDKVHATCSVSHSCPYVPPDFSWSRVGTTRHQSKKLNSWKWETVSTLIFRPGPADFKKPLNCTVHYRGRKQSTTSTMLQ
ncbi:myeloid cell surface antigen CD33-like [Mugil cephalus]|uniref:myeloid cell surface antigen CD33-like n=1 Tax=Mugil cephalus TaxID=48193 RepID=UPI001FB75BA9|nr:myeloid cell surface antigen CD33-like [Mugil cephalus]